MTKDEALREAIDTLKSTKHGNCDFAWIDETLKKCTEALAQPPLPVQEPLEYWNAVEGWVKIDEVREHFDSVGCGTIYKNGGEGRVPLYTAPPLMINGLTEAETNATASVVGLTKQAESVAWDKPSDNFNAWWDSDRHDGGNPFDTDSFAYWAFEGWQAALAQRPWQGLTEEEIMVIGDKVANEDLVGLVSNFRVRLARAIEQALKELNK